MKRGTEHQPFEDEQGLLCVHTKRNGATSGQTEPQHGGEGIVAVCGLLELYILWQPRSDGGVRAPSAPAPRAGSQGEICAARRSDAGGHIERTRAITEMQSTRRSKTAEGT
ncbi:unnamed protein product [Boreogadus saida]